MYSWLMSCAWKAAVWNWMLVRWLKCECKWPGAVFFTSSGVCPRPSPSQLPGESKLLSPEPLVPIDASASGHCLPATPCRSLMTARWSSEGGDGRWPHSARAAAVNLPGHTVRTVHPLCEDRGSSWPKTATPSSARCLTFLPH